MGNEVLHSHSPSKYPKPTESFVRVREHTVSRVLGCLDKSNILAPRTNIDIGTLNAGDIFCGYLMLDALISNQDRHHENWAIIHDHKNGASYLCPTYDHAASLGRELLDSDRKERLESRDKNRQVKAFVKKAKSELFKLKTDKKPLNTLECFFHAVKDREAAKQHWLKKLEDLSEHGINCVFDKIPHNLITPLARQFAIEMVLENRERLLNDGKR